MRFPLLLTGCLWLFTGVCFLRAEPPATTAPAHFTHPGLLHSRADLERMRAMVSAGRQPWLQGFEALRSAPQSGKDYVMQGPFKDVRYQNGQYEFRRDGTAAYQQALMWAVTGDPDYARKAIEILNAWASTMETFDKGDHISGGMGTHKFAIAAEILRYTPGSGWAEKDIEQFKVFLRRMQPSVDKPDLFLNQGGYAMMGMISIAVFLEDTDLYQRTIRRATVGDHRDPRKDPGLARTIWPSGQVVEMGRDQTHPQGGLGALSCIAQTARIQGEALTGTDLFSYLDDRLMKGFEYLAAHELGYDVEYRATDPQGNPGLYDRFQDGDRGRFAPIYELPYNHYRYVNKVPPAALRFVSEVRDYRLPEGGNDDFPGFGTLTFTLAESTENLPSAPAPATTGKDELAGRQLASKFDGTRGVGRDYYTDSFGATHLVASNIQAGDWVRYDHFDFGRTPVDTFMASAGSASLIGSNIDVLLDRLESEPVGTLHVENTGWWSTFVTFSTRLRQPVSGEHVLFLRFYGGKHVYKFECNLDWFKFGPADVIARELQAEAARPRFPVVPGAACAAVVTGTASKMNGYTETSQDGTTLSFPGVEFSNGARVLAVRAAGEGTLEFRIQDRTQAPFAVVPVPKGPPEQWQTVTVKLPETPPRLTGLRLVFVTFRDAAGSPMRLADFQLDPPAATAP